MDSTAGVTKRTEKQICIKYINSSNCEYKISKAHLYNAQIAAGFKYLKIEMINIR